MLRRLLVLSALMFAALSPLEAQRAFRVEETTIAARPRGHSKWRAHLSRAGASVSRPHRRIRQEGSGDQRDHRRESRRAQDRRFARPPIRGDEAARRSAALRPDDREGQLPDDRAADRRGNIALKGYAPTQDAFQVKRIKEAGAIVLAKSNMAEFAFSPDETVNSVLPGLHEKSVRARSRDRGIVRRNRGRRRRPISAKSGSARTRAIPFADRARTMRSSAFARRWASRAARASRR